MSYQHAGRSFFPPVSGNPSQGGNLTYSVLVDSTVIGTFSTAIGMPFTPVALLFSGTSGEHLFQWVAVSGGAETIDQTAFFDSFSVSQAPEPTIVGLLVFGAGMLLLVGRRHRS